jgi:hypothetical protein
MRLAGVVRDRAQAFDERRDDAAGELRPLDEEVVEDGLFQAKSKCGLEGCHRSGAGLRDERGELADGGARTQLDERLITAMYTESTLNDRVEVSLDCALLDQHVPRRYAHLGRELGDRREHATRNGGEQLDAVQRGDALDEPERVHRRRRVGHGSKRTPSATHGQGPGSSGRWGLPGSRHRLVRMRTCKSCGEENPELAGVPVASFE